MSGREERDAIASPAGSAAAAALRSGGLVMLAGGARRPAGQGGLFGVAALMTARTANLMAAHGGLLCVVVEPGAAGRLGLAPMPGSVSPGRERPLFLTSIEAAACPGTGISAADRAATMRAAGAPAAAAGDLRTPGHVMPMLVHAGRTVPRSLPQAALALVRRWTGYDVAAWCDVLDEAGELADAASCRRLAGALGIPAVRAEVGPPLPGRAAASGARRPLPLAAAR